MSRICLPIALIILAAAFPVAALRLAGAELSLNEQTSEKAYVCPPCGCDNHDKTYDQPGFCSSCGMALVEKGSLASQPPPAPPSAARKNVAILIFDGVQIIDYTGPYEVFGQAGFNVFTVATSVAPITTAMNMQVTPSHRLDDCPQPDVIVIPGGGVTRTQNDPAVIKWIQQHAPRAEHVLSVCNGAFILARTGLLDGLQATTFYGLIDGFVAFAPKTKVVTDQRYVDNGKIITTAGISSGIDGSLHVVERMLGRAAAQLAALNMEYNWQPDARYARASFADQHLRRIFGLHPRFDPPAGVNIKLLSTTGDAAAWTLTWQTQGEASAAELLKPLNQKLVDGGWIKQGGAIDATQSTWEFKDQKGGQWRGQANVRLAPGEKNQSLVVVEIARREK